MSEQKSIAIITARGGSKRIPKKNCKEFCGKPILLYSIEAARKSNLFDEVMVSTDSEEIAELARGAGATVPFLRSAETANDFATTAEVLLEVLDCYAERGQQFTFMCCLYPTAPFVTAERIQQGMAMLKEKKAIEIRPVVRFSFPPQRCLVLQEEKLVMKWEKYRNTRSQDLEPVYHDAGQFYCFDVKRYCQFKGQHTEDIYPLILPETEVQDIDNEEDWKLAEMKYQLLSQKLKE